MKRIEKNRKYIITSIAFFILIASPPLAVFSQSTDKQLIEKASSKGSIRLIIKIKTGYRTEGMLASPQAVEKQRNTIARTQNALLNRFASHELSNVKSFTTVPYLAMTVDAAGLETLLNASDLVTSIEEDIPVPPLLNDSVPLINADDVHAQGFDGSGWAVAVLDTGVRSSHEFLDSGKVVSEACYSTTDATNGSTTVCPNGLESQTGTGSGVNCDTSIDGCRHGTHIAGIVAGTGGTTATKGVAPGADIIAIQVFSRFDSWDFCVYTASCIGSYPSDQLAALERVYELRTTYNIAAVNMSLGGGENTNYCDTDSRKDIIDNLREAGIATVIASGNDRYDDAVGTPACISSAIAVGATDDSDNVASYSNHATIIDLMAPGSGIISSTADSDSSYASISGTSMATPHVAGAFAVLRSKNSIWTVDYIENLLKTTGVDVTRSGITKPRIDIFAAANAESSSAPVIVPWLMLLL
ncbi:MAG: S8 family serine peptidase [Candidatus Electrothrix aestuarii]|uniref:S8 family serine peptidase n=1 Tax=Candidatus Electrothrix aestuarii TaxID=3062594 RepID=A0AAU8LXD1_9BACT|nr:S8 family serine peptidase [Candidatus Electrothrix aestuarii]